MATELRKIPMMNKNKMVAPITTADAVIYENTDENINDELKSKTVQGAVDYVIEHSVLCKNVENRFRVFKVANDINETSVFYISTAVYANDEDDAQQIFENIYDNSQTIIFGTNYSEIDLSVSDGNIIIRTNGSWQMPSISLPLVTYGAKRGEKYAQFVFLRDINYDEEDNDGRYCIIYADSYGIEPVYTDNINNIDFSRIPIRYMRK